VHSQVAAVDGVVNEVEQPNISSGAEHSRYNTVLPSACLYTLLAPEILNSDGRSHAPTMLQMPRSIHPQCSGFNAGAKASGIDEQAHGSVPTIIATLGVSCGVGAGVGAGVEFGATGDGVGAGVGAGDGGGVRFGVVVAAVAGSAVVTIGAL
jgi:hypothetical protein